MASNPLDQPYRGGFIGPEHHFALTVYFEDTDTAGIIYYAKQRLCSQKFDWGRHQRDTYRA